MTSFERACVIILTVVIAVAYYTAFRGARGFFL